jgi:adenylate cyclase
VFPGVFVSATVSRAEAARQAGVSPATLDRWVRHGLVPQARADGWTPAAVSHARMVARLRERGHRLEEIRAATVEGRLAFGFVEDLLPPRRADYTLREAADATGLEPALIERILHAMGFGSRAVDRIGDADVALLRNLAEVLAAGFPLVALLQLARVYGQALAQIADAEVRLFHLYVHEPLMRDGVPGPRIAEEMQDLARELLPLASPVMKHVHTRFLQHFMEQDVVGHMETDLAGAPLHLGRMRVAIAFVDLAGYTRLTEEIGEDQAVDVVERFIEHVELTLPEDARLVKTIGDEVMVVSSDAGALTDWAVGFQELHPQRPRPRIGIHCGETLYRDGEFYGREVNQASRVAARAAGGEVLVTRPVVSAGGPHLDFERIGEVRLRGFNEPTELFLARVAA